MRDARDRAPLAFGVDVGGTKVLGVALNGRDEVVAEARVGTPRRATDPAGAGGPGASEAAGAVEVVVRDLITRTGADEQGAPVGVGVPGMVDRRGVLHFSPNLRGAAGADVAAALRVRLPACELLVENDANCAALAEVRLGAARGSAHAVMVTLGTGIGGGLIAEGRVVVGAHGFAGEIGHMTVDPSGPPCPCGRRGCWERYASGAGLAMLAREAAQAGRLATVVVEAGGDPELVRGEHVTGAALAGDPDALAVMEELGWWVALGLANLAAVLDTGRFVVGGGLVEAGDILLVPTRAAFARLVEGAPARPDTDVVAAALGERAGAVGAALAARDGGLL